MAAESNLVAAPATEIQGDTLPNWLLLAPAGAFAGRDGRTYSNPDPLAVVARFQAGGVDLPFDTEHATHLRAPNGQPAPAVAWIDLMDVRDGGVWGHVNWTDAGVSALRSRAYRYYSPAYTTNQARELVCIESVGLTNKPNLDLVALNQQGQAGGTEEAARIAAMFGNTPADLARYARIETQLHRAQAGSTEDAARIAAAFGNTPADLARHGQPTT
jgi:hypothetical protein